MPLGTSVPPTFRATVPDLWYIRVDVDARDDTAAARQAHALYQRTADLVWAESGEKIPDTALVATHCSADQPEFSVQRSSEARLTPSANRLSLGAHFQERGFAGQLSVDVPALLPDSSAHDASRDRFTARSHARLTRRAVAARRIADAVRAARIAADQPYGETSLTTLWTALEVLAHRNYHTGIIERVVRSITPILGSRKVRDLTNEVSHYLRQYLMRDVPPERQSRFIAQFPDLLAPEFVADPTGPLRLDGPMLLGALADQRRSIAIGRFAEDSPIIVYRLMRFSDSVQTGADLVERVLGATRRVEWQLRRVYRLRNDITHVARFTGGDERLHEHLQLYVSSAVDALATVLSADAGIETIEDAVAAIDGEFQQWIDRVRLMGRLCAPPDSALTAPLALPAARATRDGDSPTTESPTVTDPRGVDEAHHGRGRRGRRGASAPATDEHEPATPVGSPQLWRHLYTPPYAALVPVASADRPSNAP